MTNQLEPRIYGGVDDDDSRAVSAVVALRVGPPGDYQLCSAVLVAPNVVLTARHCVANSITSSVSCDEHGQSTNGKHVDGNQKPEAITLYTGNSPRFGAPDAVGKAIVSPESDYLCDSDIALVVLDRSIANVEPVAVRLSVGVAPGETIRSVGYGQNDQKMPLGTRFRKANVAVLAMGATISQSKTALGPHEFEVGLSTCQGDSGGPALSEDTGAVVGVVSRGGQCTEDFGHIYTTTAGWQDLFTQAFSIAGGAPITESGTPVGPEIGPAPRPTPKALPPPPAAKIESCAMSHAPGSGSTALALAFGAAALAFGTRRRRSRVDDA